MGNNNKQKKVNKKSDLDVLLEGKEINGYMVKPWTVGIVYNQKLPLAKLITYCKEEKISIDDFSTLFNDPIKMIDLIPFVVEIVAVTIDIKIEEVNKWGMSDLVEAGLVIFNQNIFYLKNLISQINQTIALMNG